MRRPSPFACGLSRPCAGVRAGACMRRGGARTHMGALARVRARTRETDVRLRRNVQQTGSARFAFCSGRFLTGESRSCDLARLAWRAGTRCRKKPDAGSGKHRARSDIAAFFVRSPGSRSRWRDSPNSFHPAGCAHRSVLQSRSQSPSAAFRKSVIVSGIFIESGGDESSNDGCFYPPL